ARGLWYSLRDVAPERIRRVITFGELSRSRSSADRPTRGRRPRPPFFIRSTSMCDRSKGPALPAPAFPVVGMAMVSHTAYNHPGMSRRACFAALVAAGLAGAVASGNTAFDPQEIVRQALQVADALLEGLDAPRGP